jgi:hypothetical protein
MKMQLISNIISKKRILLFLLFTSSCTISFSQRIEPINKDSTTISEKKIVQEKKIDSATKKIYSPKKAATLSAIFPGLGQIYNKKYWKLPIVYAAMGISGGIFKYNLGWYRKTRFAYKVLVTKDTSNFPNVDPALKFLIDRNDAGGLRNARDQYRRDIDYSALFFIIMWGLNVVDATVDAHLKAFDVSPVLSLRIKPGHSEMAGTNGISLVLSIR